MSASELNDLMAVQQSPAVRSMRRYVDRPLHLRGPNYLYSDPEPREEFQPGFLPLEPQRLRKAYTLWFEGSSRLEITGCLFEALRRRQHLLYALWDGAQTTQMSWQDNARCAKLGEALLRERAAEYLPLTFEDPPSEAKFTRSPSFMDAFFGAHS